MNSAYWKTSFTKRRFLRDQETLPPDAVQQVEKQVDELHQNAVRWIRLLHDERYHSSQCMYPQSKMEQQGTCVACQTIHDVRILLLTEVYVHISGVVLDFFHEPDHKEQLAEAVKLYAWSLFHWQKDQTLVRWRNELMEYAQYRLDDLYGESFAHKPIRDEQDEEMAQPGETTREDLKPLVIIFAKTYSALVHEFDAWRRENIGIPVFAFPSHLFDPLDEM